MAGFANGYALIVGVANYPRVTKLPPAVLQDARDLYALLRSADYCGYPDTNVKLLVDQEATGQAIRDRLSWLAGEAGPGDTAMIYFSGHGGQVTGASPGGGQHGAAPSGSAFLLPYDCDLSRPNETAISGAEITELLRNIPAQRLFVVLDCCYAAGVAEPKAASVPQPIFKAGLEEDYYERLAQGSGRVILASCLPNEVSLVVQGMNNSVFTHCLLEALRGKARTRGDDMIRVFDLFEYVSEAVPALGQDQQHPFFKSALQNNFPISLYLGASQSQPAAAPAASGGAAPSSAGYFLQNVPAIPNFTGREVELAAYRERLEEQFFAIITGMAGAGKTWLGAKLAKEAAARPEDIFWFAFDRNENSSSESLLWALSAFLDCNGWPEMWRYLNGEVGVHRTMGTNFKLNSLLRGLQAGSYVICLDEFEVVKDDPGMVDFFSFLQEYGRSTEGKLPARFIVMGRELPREMNYLLSRPLGGFSLADAKDFLEDSRVQISDEFLFQLWTLTEGNPMLLSLSASTLQSMGSEQVTSEEFIGRMAEEGDVRDFLMYNLLVRLSSKEKEALNCLSIFPAPLDREDAKAILPAAGISKVSERIAALSGKGILIEEAGGFLRLHGLVREYCYRLLEPEDRQRFHTAAAEYFLGKRKYLQAAYHQFELGAIRQALDLLTGNVRAIVHAGGAGALLKQLGRFRWRDLTSEQKSALSQARGEAYRTIGQYQQALDAYETAREYVRDDYGQAQILYGIALARSMGGNYAAALEDFREGLRLSENASEPLISARIQCGMAWVLYRLEQLEEAGLQFQACREAGQELDDEILRARAGLGLGLLALKGGRLQDAQRHFERSLDRFQDNEDRIGEVEALTDLGLLYSKRGDQEQERALYKQAMEAAEDTGDVHTLRIIYNNLGYLNQLSSDYAQAADCYQKLAQLAQDTGHKPMLSTAYTGLADAYLGSGNVEQALASAQDALRVAQEADSTIDLAVSCRALGDVWLARGDSTQAKDYYQQSIPLLEALSEDDDLAKARQGLERALASLGNSIPEGEE